MTLTLPTKSNVHCWLARTAADMDDVFRLRHQCYLRSGAIAGRPDGRFRDTFDDLPNHFSYLARDERGEALATVRISVLRPDLGWNDTPACHVFGDDPNFQSIARSSYVEASRLCFAHTARRDAFYGLLGHMAATAERYAVEWLAACPRVEHSQIYQRLYGFRPMAAPRPYFGVNFETELLATRVSEIRELASRTLWMDLAWDRARANVFPV